MASAETLPGEGKRRECGAEITASAKPKILLAVGDTGAWAYFAPVFSKLRERYDVELLADPKGAAINDIKKAGIFHRATDGSHLLECCALEGVSAVLCGTAGKAFDLWENATKATLRADVSAAWLGDFYSSGCETRMREYAPDYFAAFDDTTMSRFWDLHPYMPERSMRVVGNPSFDAIAAVNLRAMRKKARMEFGIGSCETLAIYSGSSMGQFDLEHESLDNLLPWAKARGVRFAFRFHPADEKNKSDDVARLKARMKDELGGQLVDTGNVKGLDLAAAADVFITDYSTEGVRSTLAGIPTVFLMLPTANEYLVGAKGSTFPHFSILEENIYVYAPALVARIAEEVQPTLNKALSPTVRSCMADMLTSERYKPLRDGHAGERVLEFIRGVVGE